MERRLVRRNKLSEVKEPQMDFSSRNARLLSTFGLIGILSFLISIMYQYIQVSSRILNIESNIPLDVNDILSACLMSSVVIIFIRLIFYCYHEFSSFAIETNKEIVFKSDESYKKVIFSIPFLFSINGIVLVVLMMTSARLDTETIIFTVVITVLLIALINVIPLGSIDLGFNYRWKIELSFILLSLLFIYLNILNIKLNIDIDVLFQNDGKIEFNMFGPIPEEASVSILRSNNTIMIKKQIEESDFSRAFLEYTQASNYDQIPDSNIKIEKTINIDECFYKYKYIDVIKKPILKENEKYYYIIQLEYDGFFEKKNIQIINEFFYDGSFHFTHERFVFSE